MRNEHILIIRLSSMEDVLMLVPIVKALAEQYPNIRITVLSRSFAKEFFENLAPNVGFMEAYIKKDKKGIREINNLCRRLLAKKFSIVADMQNVLKTKYIRLRLNAAGSKVAHINKHKTTKQRIKLKINTKSKPLSPSYQDYAETLSKLGYPITFNCDNT